MQSNNFNFTTWLTLPWADAADTAEAYFRSTNNLSIGVDPLQLESQLKSNLSLLIKKAVQAARLLKSRNEAPLPRSSIFASNNNNNNNQHHQVQIDKYLHQNHGGLTNQPQQHQEKDESHALDVYLRFLKYALENNNSDGTLIVLFAADDFKALKQLKPVFSECLLDRTIAMWVDSRGTAPRRSGLGLLHCLADYSRFKEFIANEFFGSLFSFLVQSPPDVEHGPADDDFAARRVCAQVITAAIRSSKATKLFAVKNKLIDQIVPLVRDTPTGDFYLQLQCFEILYRVTRVETSKVLPRLELPELIRRSLEPGNTKLSDGDKFINNLIEILDVYNNQRVHQYNNNNNNNNNNTTTSSPLSTLLHSYRVNSYDIVLEEKFRADDKDPNATFLARASANNTQIIFSSRNAVLLLPESNGANHTFPLRQIAHFRISRDHTLCLGFKKIDQEFFKGFYGNTDSSIQSEEEFRNLEHAIMQRQVDQQQQQQQQSNNNNENTTTRKKTFWISVSLSLDPTVGSEIREGPVQGWVKNAFERKKNFTSRTNTFKQQLMMMMMTENRNSNHQQQQPSATGSRLPSPTPIQQQQQQQQPNDNNTRSANGSQQGGGSFSSSSFGNHRDPNSFNNNNNINVNGQQQQKNQQQQQQQQQQQSSAPPSLGNMFNFGGGATNEMNNNNNNSSSSSSFSNFAFLNNQQGQHSNQNNTSSFQQRPSCSRLSVSISQQRANSTTASSFFGQQQQQNTNNTNNNHQLFSSSAQQMYEMSRKQQQDKAKEMLKQCLEVVNARLDEVRKEDERDVQEYENWVKSETSALMGGLETSKKRAIEELTKLDSSVSSAFEGYKKFVGNNNNNNSNKNENQQNQQHLPDQLYSRQEIMEFAQDVASDLEKLHQLIEGTAQDTEQHYHDQVAQLKSELENSLQQCSDTIASISAESAMPEEFVRRFNLSSTSTTASA